MPAALTTDPIKALIGVTPKSDFDLTKIVERGLPTARLALLKEHGLTFTEVSEIVISPRTLKHRKARKERLSDEETDRMGGRRPLSILRTDAGGRLVESQLWQIDEGIFA